jgi:hypothetical protein
MLTPKYDRLTSVKDGVIRLLTIRDYAIPEFDVEPKADGDYTKTLVLEGKRIPLLFWRYEPRMNAIRNYGKKVETNCSINVSSFFGKDTTLDEVIYRELDIAEYALHSKIVKVTAFINGDACNLIAKCESGAQANLELGATMAPGTIPQFQHRLITKHGMANDKGVNDLIEQNGVYVFSDSDTRPVVYDDGEYYLYGLGVEDSVICTYVLGIIRERVCADALVEQDKHLRVLLDAVYESARLGKSVFVGGAK